MNYGKLFFWIALLLKKTFKGIIKFIEIMKKSIIAHLTIYSIFITLLIFLIIINKPFSMLEINFEIPIIYLWTLLFVLLVGLIVIVIFEVFSEKEYDENKYYKIAKGIWHLFFLAISIIILGIISMISIVYLSKISSFYLSLVIVFIIIIIFLAKINNFAKKKGIKIYNPISWVKEKKS